jgi:hypothetical protein
MVRRESQQLGDGMFCRKTCLPPSSSFAIKEIDRLLAAVLAEQSAAGSLLIQLSRRTSHGSRRLWFI